MSSVALVSLDGSPLHPPGENAYIIVRDCAGLLAVQSLRRSAAHAALVTRGPGHVEPLLVASPPVHSICHETLPRLSV